MARDPCFDILFEPVRIGPLTTRNRFFQVPPCSGRGHLMPRSDAAMRSMKAEGGGVGCTELCSFHPHAEIAPHPEIRLAPLVKFTRRRTIDWSLISLAK